MTSNESNYDEDESPSKLGLIVTLIGFAILILAIAGSCTVERRYVNDSLGEIISLVNDRTDTATSSMSGGMVFPFAAVSSHSETNKELSYMFYVKDSEGIISFLTVDANTTKLKFGDNPKCEKARLLIKNRCGDVYEGSEFKPYYILTIPEKDFNKYISVDIKEFKK